MARFTSPLDNINIAAPCSSDWNQMVGDERVRFCRQCSLNVYNLSSLTRREAEALISNTEGRLCVRYYRRRDGTILTDNCPVGLIAIKRRLSRTASAMLSAALSFLAGLGLYAGTVNKEPSGYSGGMRTMGVLTSPKVDAVRVDEPPAIVGELTVDAPAYEKGEVIRKIRKPARRVTR